MICFTVKFLQWLARFMICPYVRLKYQLISMQSAFIKCAKSFDVPREKYLYTTLDFINFLFKRRVLIPFGMLFPKITIFFPTNKCFLIGPYTRDS